MRDRSLCKIVEKSVSLYGIHITGTTVADITATHSVLRCFCLRAALILMQ